MPRKKKEEVVDEKLNGTFNVQSLESALVEIHDKDQLSIDKVKALLEASLLKAYKDWWCLKNGFQASANANDLKATIYVDWESGNIHLCDAWDIVATDDDIEDDFYQVSLEQAQENGIPSFRKEEAEKLREEASKARDSATLWEKKVQEAPSDEVKKGAEAAREDDLQKAQALEKKAEDLLSIRVGGISEKEIDYGKLDRLYIRRVISDFHQRMREEGRKTLMEFYSNKLGHNIVGTVSQVDESGQNVDVDFGKAHGLLGRRDVLPGEAFHVGEQVKVFLKGVTERDGSPSLEISRTSEGYVKALFEEEVPEVADGTVAIKRIARQAGVRSKVMVASDYPNVDPVGAVLGQGSLRYRNILSELGRETVDVSKYTGDRVLDILEALKPASIVGLFFADEDDPREPVIAVCSNDNKKVAVGRAGCNVRLAGRLVGREIKILEVDEALAQKVHYTPISTLHEEAQARLEKLFAEREQASKAVSQQVPSSQTSEPSYSSKKPDLSNRKERSDFVDDTKVDAEILSAASKVRDAQKEALAEREDEESTSLGIEAQKKESEGVLPSASAVEVEKPVAPVEHVEITGKARVSLTALEEQIERDREREKNQVNRKPWYAKPRVDKKKEEEKKKPAPDASPKPVNALPIYTEEELAELEKEENGGGEGQGPEDSDDFAEYDDDSYYDDEKNK